MGRTKQPAKHGDNPPELVRVWGYIFRALNRGLDESLKPGQKTDDEHWEARASFTRSDLYERRFLDSMRRMAEQLPGLSLRRFRDDDDAFVSMLKAMHNDDEPLLFSLVGPNRPEMNPDMGVAAVSMREQYRAFIAFGYTISDLLAQTRAGSDEALIRAVRVDPSVLGGRTAAIRMARAAGAGDRKFFARLAEAIRKPGKLDLTQGARLNAALRMMTIAGQLDQLTPPQAYQLFVKEIRLFPERGVEDPQTALWQKIWRFKRSYSSKFPEKVKFKPG